MLKLRALVIFSLLSCAGPTLLSGCGEDPAPASGNSQELPPDKLAELQASDASYEADAKAAKKKGR